MVLCPGVWSQALKDAFEPLGRLFIVSRQGKSDDGEPGGPMKAFVLFIILASSSQLQAMDAEKCNQKIAQAIYKQAQKRCAKRAASKIERVVWSEKELGITQKGKGIVGGVYFQCTNNLEYLAVAEITVDNCQLKSIRVSHTSEVTNSYIGQ